MNAEDVESLGFEWVYPTVESLLRPFVIQFARVSYPVTWRLR